MGDINGTGGPQKPHWQQSASNVGDQGSAPGNLQPKLGTDKFTPSSSGSTPVLSGLGAAAKALGKAGGQAAQGASGVANAASRTLGHGVRTALHALFDPSSNGDAVRDAVAAKDAAALKAALKAKRPDGTDAWDKMDEKTRKLIDSKDPGIREGLAAMMNTPQMRALIVKIKSDPKAASDLSKRIDKLSHKQTDEAVKGIDKMKKNPSEGLKAASQIDRFGSSGQSTIQYCNI